MRPEMVRTFIEEFHRQVNRQASEQDLRHDRTKRDLGKTEREIQRLIEAIKAGVPGDIIKGEMGHPRNPAARAPWSIGKIALSRPQTASQHGRDIPKKIVNLGEALNDERTRTEAAECIRKLLRRSDLCRKKASSGLSYSAGSQPSSTLATRTPVLVERGLK